MEDAGNPRFVAAHARDIAARRRADTDGLAAMMLRWAWPAGHPDRFDPVSAEWLRRWRPPLVESVPDPCSCTQGRCAVCN